MSLFNYFKVKLISVGSLLLEKSKSIVSVALSYDYSFIIQKITAFVFIGPNSGYMEKKDKIIFIDWGQLYVGCLIFWGQVYLGYLIFKKWFVIILSESLRFENLFRVAVTCEKYLLIMFFYRYYLGYKIADLYMFVYDRIRLIPEILEFGIQLFFFGILWFLGLCIFIIEEIIKFFNELFFS